jgi:hypothetical protein
MQAVKVHGFVRFHDQPGTPMMTIEDDQTGQNFDLMAHAGLRRGTIELSRGTIEGLIVPDTRIVYEATFTPEQVPVPAWFGDRMMARMRTACKYADKVYCHILGSYLLGKLDSVRHELGKAILENLEWSMSDPDRPKCGIPKHLRPAVAPITHLHFGEPMVPRRNLLPDDPLSEAAVNPTGWLYNLGYKEHRDYLYWYDHAPAEL